MAPRSFVFAHIADAHVGAWPRDPVVREALRESVLRALRVVSERNCEFLLISGDLFHTPAPDPTEVAPVVAELRNLVAEGRRIYLIYGSHDYQAHRTSWLDVLAESGLFVRAAAEPVRSEGVRWTLPFRVDGPTGARIAGISGRAHGLDRSYFGAVDSSAFCAEPGFKIFQFHAAIREYLPESLRPHVEGVSLADLPAGCDYYAGGHIHQTYQGEGPGGGLLVNPGAVFGTRRPDLVDIAQHRTEPGVVIVTVRDGLPSPEFVVTAPRDALRVFDVDVGGRSVDEARRWLHDEILRRSAPGALLFPHVQGTLADGGDPIDLGLSETSHASGSTGARGVQWDVQDLVAPGTGASEASPTEPELEEAALRRLSESAPPLVAAAFGVEGMARLRDLLRELGQPPGEGETRSDYGHARTEAARRILGVRGARATETRR